MNLRIEKFLCAALSQGADYKTSQQLKSGDFADVAIQAIKKQRKSVSITTVLMICMAALPVILMLIFTIAFESFELRDAQFGFFAILVVMQVPGLVNQRASLSSLETFLSLWALTEDDEAEPDNDKAAVREFLFPGIDQQMAQQT